MDGKDSLTIRWSGRELIRHIKQHWIDLIK
jgi:hypothetical protein